MLHILHSHIVPAAYAVLPPAMQSDRATAMLLAIALQESKCAHRYQVPREPGGKPGPARGLWQFEAGGAVKGVLTHPKTQPYARSALVSLCYSRSLTVTQIHAHLEHNDVLAAVFARLNLWWLPEALPPRDGARDGWRQYLESWRPGEPHPETWDGYYTRAWTLVAAHRTEGG